MPTREELSKAITRTIQRVLTEKGPAPDELGLDTPVDRSLGLDSLDWAAVVVQLEGDLAVDPFAEGVDRELRTVRDLVDVYEAALG